MQIEELKKEMEAVEQRINASLTDCKSRWSSDAEEIKAYISELKEGMSRIKDWHRTCPVVSDFAIAKDKISKLQGRQLWHGIMSGWFLIIVLYLGKAVMFGDGEIQPKDVLPEVRYNKVKIEHIHRSLDKLIEDMEEILKALGLDNGSL